MRGETRDFFKLALADQPPIPFRVPSDIRLVRVNLKTGLPTGPNDPKAILEAFKPNEGPADAGTADEASTGEPESAPAEALGQGSAEPANTSALGSTAPVAPKPPAPLAVQSSLAPKQPPVAGSDAPVAQRRPPSSVSQSPFTPGGF